MLFFAECRRSCVVSGQKCDDLSTFPYSGDCSLLCSFDFTSLCVGFPALSSCYFTSRQFGRAVSAISFIALHRVLTPLLSFTILSSRIIFCDRFGKDGFGEDIVSPVHLSNQHHTSVEFFHHLTFYHSSRLLE